MELLTQIKILCAHLEAEVKLVEARLMSALHEVNKRADAAGVARPSAATPVVGAGAPIVVAAEPAIKAPAQATA